MDYKELRLLLKKQLKTNALHNDMSNAAYVESIGINKADYYNLDNMNQIYGFKKLKDIAQKMGFELQKEVMYTLKANNNETTTN